MQDSLFHAFLSRFEDFSRLHLALTDPLTGNDTLSAKGKQALRSEFRDLFTAAHAALANSDKAEADQIARKMAIALRFCKRAGVNAHIALAEDEEEGQKLLISFANLMKQRMKRPLLCLPNPLKEPEYLSFEELFDSTSEFYNSIKERGDFYVQRALLSSQERQILCDNLHQVWVSAQIELMVHCKPEKVRQIKEALVETFSWASVAGTSVPNIVGLEQFSSMAQKIASAEEFPDPGDSLG